MRKRFCNCRLIVFSGVALVLIGMLSAAPPPDPSNSNRDGGLMNAIDRLNSRARAYGLINQSPPSQPTPEVVENFEVLGHNALGMQDANGDVWVHGSFAYVGTWAFPCTGRGVKIIDVSNLAAPRVIGSVGSRPGTSAEDVVVRSVATAYFQGDLLATGLQRCAWNIPALDRQTFGLELWDVSNPRRPRKLSEMGLSDGGGGIHELDFFQRGERVYVLAATPFTEWFNRVPRGDFRIIDVTDPRNPVEIAHWGAGANGHAPGPFYGLGSTAFTYAHSARASEDGLRAYVSYWDLGVLTFDISDPYNPVLSSRTLYPQGADGDAHSVSEYAAGGRRFLLQNDEDADPRSPALIHYGAGGLGYASESPGGSPLWLQPAQSLTSLVIQSANQGCTPGEYPPGTLGKIALARTPFPFFDPVPGEVPLCSQRRQDAAASAAGAAALVHDFISTATSPQWWDFGDVPIPVLFTDHATADGMRVAGSATLEAQPPTLGFIRIFDAETGQQVAKFDDVPNVHALPSPPGWWIVHNNEVVGSRSYASWYSNGIVAIDLSPLDQAVPSDPVRVGRFVPAGAPSAAPGFIEGNVAQVWGVAVRASDNVIFASDMNSGLWIIRPTGRAAP